MDWLYKKISVRHFITLFLCIFSTQLQARIDDTELERMRTFAAQEQGALIYNGFVIKNHKMALPSDRDEESFRRSRKVLRNEMQHWNSRIRIITSWPRDQAVRAIGDGFIEIVDLGHFYTHFSRATSTRAEAVRRLLSSESEGITSFISGMAEFEQRFYESSGGDLKESYASMKNIAIAYMREIVRFLDNRNNKALLDLYNENRHAYLNRQSSRYAERYLEAVENLIDFERVTYLYASDIDPRTVAKELANYSEKFEEAKDLLAPYLKEQRKHGNRDHADRLQQGFDALMDDFESSKNGFRVKFPDAARKQKL